MTIYKCDRCGKTEIVKRGFLPVDFCFACCVPSSGEKDCSLYSKEQHSTNCVELLHELLGKTGNFCKDCKIELVDKIWDILHEKRSEK